MRTFLCVLFCILAIAVHGQEGKTKRRVVDMPSYYFKAERFIQMNDADRMLYVAGLIDGFSASVLFGASDQAVAPLNSCTKDMDSMQVSAIITKYVKDHPENWHYPLNIEAYNALNKACPGGLRIVK